MLEYLNCQTEVRFVVVFGYVVKKHVFVIYEMGFFLSRDRNKYLLYVLFRMLLDNFAPFLTFVKIYFLQ